MVEQKRLISPRQARQVTSLSERHLKRLADEGKFPKPVSLGEGGRNSRIDRGSLAGFDVQGAASYCNVSEWETLRILAALTHHCLIVGDMCEVSADHERLIIGNRISGDWPQWHKGSK